jgi:hypothetical protein
MKRIILPVLFIGILTIAFFYFKSSLKAPQPANNSDNSSLIIVDYPKPNDIVTSPLTIRGRASGTWFFEGDAPVTLYWGVGDSFADSRITAKGEWMTTDFVEFEGTVVFPEPDMDYGDLFLYQDNPSDIQGSREYIKIPVRFR